MLSFGSLQSAAHAASQNGEDDPSLDSIIPLCFLTDAEELCDANYTLSNGRGKNTTFALTQEFLAIQPSFPHFIQMRNQRFQQDL